MSVKIPEPLLSMRRAFSGKYTKETAPKGVRRYLERLERDPDGFDERLLEVNMKWEMWMMKYGKKKSLEYIRKIREEEKKEEEMSYGS